MPSCRDSVVVQGALGRELGGLSQKSVVHSKPNGDRCALDTAHMILLARGFVDPRLCHASSARDAQYVDFNEKGSAPPRMLGRGNSGSSGVRILFRSRTASAARVNMVW